MRVAWVGCGVSSCFCEGNGPLSKGGWLRLGLMIFCVGAWGEMFSAALIHCTVFAWVRNERGSVKQKAYMGVLCILALDLRLYVWIGWEGSVSSRRGSPCLAVAAV